MGFQKPQDVLNALAHAYYEKRDVGEVLACVTDDVIWIGTEKNHYAQGKIELKTVLEEDVKAFPNAFHTDLEEPEMRPLGSNAVILTLTGHHFTDQEVPVEFAIRATVYCVKTVKGWLISSIHVSAPNAAREKIALQNVLDEERKKQNALLDNIPGGIAMYRLKKDGRIVAEFVSEGLAKLFGYDNSKDIMRIMGHDARDIIPAESMPVVQAALDKFKANGGVIYFHNWIKRKDGTRVQVSVDAVSMDNVDLGEDDVAMFYAVQAAVSNEESKKAEEDKVLLDLLNTVPVGIGIFDITKEGIAQNYLNDSFYQMLGTKREDRTQYFGSNALSSTHPHDVANVKASMQKMIDGDTYTQVYYRVKNGQGNWNWLHLTAAVVERNTDYIKVHVAFYECTESKRYELELIQSQKAVQLAQEQGRLSIWTYNIDKGIILQQVMQESAGHMGYAPHISNVPRCFTDNGKVHPDDVEKYLELYQQLADGEDNVNVLYRLLNNHTGKFDWLRMYYKRMEDNDEGDRMAVGFAIEVNKQQEAVERYEIEQKLRKQMYADAAIYIEYNLTNNHYAGTNNLDNKYLDRNWEFPNEEEYRQNMSHNVDAAYLDEMVAKMYAGNLLKAFVNGENKVSCEYRSRAYPERPSRWYRVTAVMVKRPDTEDIMAFVYVEDIDEKKNRQLAIENGLSNTKESVALICIADKSGYVIQTHNHIVPEVMKENFIYDDEFVKRAHTVVISEGKDDGGEAAMLSTVIHELEKQDIYQYAISTKVGNEPTKRQLFSFRYLDDRKSHIVVSVSDVTSVYEKEQQKKQELESALKDAQLANLAKAEFYSRMSHDMRTPMNGILGMAELSEDETDTAKLKENIAKIKESGEYLLNLINDTLDLQRIESGKMKLEPKIVGIKDVVGNILDMVSLSAKNKGVHLKYNKGNTDLNWYIRGDALRLKQIFINLLSNAIKFTPADGTVEFEFKLLEREGMISHDVIYVRDTGIGMSKEFLKSGIFQPFSQENNTLSATYAGSGLGLSIAKNLVELMGGRIEVESELGVGTTFAVYLDFERVDADEAKNALAKEKNHSHNVSEKLKGKKILLAEDHPLNAEISKKLLEKTGCSVVWAKNGQEAVDRFAEAQAHEFDAILMDIRMPVMTGLEATRIIRCMEKDDAKTVPIIAMTANAYAEDRKESLAAGMNAHIGKPINPKLLYDTIAKYIH